MSGRRKKVLTIAAAIAPVVLGVWSLQHFRERRKAAEREAYYQAVLAQYTGELKPGMSREQVEKRLQTDGKQFTQLCCAANFRGQYVSSLEGGWDDLIKIGEESPPWFCSANNVYISFEFNPKSKGELPKTNVSDVLKRVSVVKHLEGCL